MPKPNQIIIVGAGLTGTLLAIYLGKMGYSVDVYEKRPDLRSSPEEKGRSINLALSSRGIRALEAVGISQSILGEAVPMRGRMLHDTQSQEKFVPYGKDDSEYINSVSRNGLNRNLLDLAESIPGVRFFFEQQCLDYHLDEKAISFRDTSQDQVYKREAQLVLAADGAGSVIRQGLEAKRQNRCSTEFLSYGYKELTIPSLAKGGFQLEPHALHIWPRGAYMLIALPNAEGSFTCTLFLANHGNPSFEGLNEEAKILPFFEENFPDALRLMPDLLEEFQSNPIGLLGTVWCYPWAYEDQVLLIGDAAHAIVPFYGQGMNASFEDCYWLAQYIRDYQGNWGEILPAYQRFRKKDTDAIAQLAIENFYEMRDGVAEPAFLMKRQLEFQLENKYADYHSKYSLVTFHPEVPYSVAHSRGNQQNKILLDICRKGGDMDKINVDAVYQQLKKEVGF